MVQPPRNSGRKRMSARSGKECRSVLERVQRLQSELRVRLADVEKKEGSLGPVPRQPRHGVSATCGLVCPCHAWWCPST